MKIYNICYALGFASVLVSASQYLPAESRNKKQDGLFIGHWAPTFFIIGKILEDKEINKRGLVE